MKRIHRFISGRQRITIVCLLILVTYGKTSGQLKISSGAVITTTGNVQVYINDLDIDNAGTLDALGGHFYFTGTGNNSITGNGSVITFGNFTINKSTGRLLTLYNPVTITGNVNFISGHIELNNQVINLNNTGLFSGESETSHVTGTSGGSVNAYALLNAPAAVNIANLGAVISSAANLGTVTISRKHLSANIPVAGGKSIYRSYDFTATNNSALNATLTINYFDTELNGINENTLTQFETTDNITYNNMGFSGRDAVTNFVTQTGYNSLTRFTLSNPAGALPVTLTSFAAQCHNNIIQLSWTTANEQNSDRFDIQRSNNGIIWEKLATIKAAGNSSTVSFYRYEDKTLYAATAFYRLAQYDANGTSVYSAIVKGGCGTAAFFSVQPNPVVDVVKVIVGTATNNTGTFILYNAAGQQVMQQRIALTAGINQVSFNMESLAKGNYNLVVKQNFAADQTIKIIKQ